MCGQSYHLDDELKRHIRSYHVDALYDLVDNVKIPTTILMEVMKKELKKLLWVDITELLKSPGDNCAMT